MSARNHRRTARAGTLIGGALFALVAGALPAVAAPGEASAASDAAGSDGSGSLVMVLDSSGSMGDDDGTGRTRMESARAAVGTVVDGLPDGYPTGLRVYGADRPQGCTDTRLVRPVRKLDRAAVKRAVAGVRPRGDTPIGLSLRKAAQDLPQPGAAVDTFDALSTRIEYDEHGSCGTNTERFQQKEGAAPLTSAVARIRSEEGTRTCDRAGRYRLVVERESKKGSDAARWPLELVYGVEAPLEKGVTPAQSQAEYGSGGKEATLPAGDPRDVRGGTGFNDARAIGQGVWRDRILPSQTLWYRVPAGWGQQVRYDVEFANEPTVDRGSATYSYGATRLYTPARYPLTGGGEFTSTTMYNGRPSALRMGGVPVSWTNRYENRNNVQPVHAGGGFYISVTLGARAAEIAENPQIALVLRVSVLGAERTGPQHGAPVRAGSGSGADEDAGKKGDSIASADSGGAGGAGWTGIAAAAGAAVVALPAAVFVYVRNRRGAAARSTRGSA